MRLKKLTVFMDKVLELEKFPHDGSNNGLQVESSSEVKKLAVGVDASMELFEAALETGADLVLVHHGLSWNGGIRYFRDLDGKRLRFLFNHGISLYAVHLPLDANLKFGNNAELAKLINLGNVEPFFEYDGEKIGVIGDFEKKMLVKDIGAVYEDRLDTKCKIHGDNDLMVGRAAIVSGGGGRDALLAAADIGAELLITGEFDHSMYHLCQELKLPVLSLGHYSSETVGVRALAELVRDEFQIPYEFIDIPTGL